MRIRPALIMIILLINSLLVGCGNSDSNSNESAYLKDEKLEAARSGELRMKRYEELLRQIKPKQFPWSGIFYLPDLKPKTPTIFAFGNNTAQFNFKVKNSGDAASGAFNLEAEIWLIEGVNAQGVGSNPRAYSVTENWPSIPAGDSLKSGDFKVPHEIDISDIDRPIGVAIFVTVDPPTTEKPRGAVIELNDSHNDNFEIYSSDPNDPTSPWFIH
ncbi:MAG: hypothetical protein ACWA5K_07340 [bacterium]